MVERVRRDKWAWVCSFPLFFGLLVADIFTLDRGYEDALAAVSDPDSVSKLQPLFLFFFNPHISEIPDYVSWYIFGVIIAISFVFGFIISRAKNPPPLFMRLIRGALIFAIVGSWAQFLILDNSFDDWQYFACFLVFLIIMYEPNRLIRDWIRMFEQARRDKWAWLGAWLCITGLAAADSFNLYRSLDKAVLSDSEAQALADSLFFLYPSSPDVSGSAGAYFGGAALAFSALFRLVSGDKKFAPPAALQFIRGVFVFLISACLVEAGILIDDLYGWEYFIFPPVFFVIMYLRKEKHHAI